MTPTDLKRFHGACVAALEGGAHLVDENEDGTAEWGHPSAKAARDISDALGLCWEFDGWQHAASKAAAALRERRDSLWGESIDWTVQS